MQKIITTLYTIHNSILEQSNHNLCYAKNIILMKLYLCKCKREISCVSTVNFLICVARNLAHCMLHKSLTCVCGV